MKRDHRALMKMSQIKSKIVNNNHHNNWHLKIMLLSRCNFGKGEGLRWIIWWIRGNSRNKTLSGKSKGRIISETFKISKRIKTISKAVQEGTNSTVISTRHNQSISRNRTNLNSLRSTSKNKNRRKNISS